MFNEIDWLALKACIIIQQKNKCAMCKKLLEDLEFTLHHIMPRAKGGKDELDNSIGLCDECHDIAEDKQLSRKEIINYKKYQFMEEHAVHTFHVYNKKILGYKYPKEIILKEKYIMPIKRQNKYKLEYGYTLKEIAKLFRIDFSTALKWTKDPIQEKILIKSLEGIKKSEDKNLCYIL